MGGAQKVLADYLSAFQNDIEMNLKVLVVNGREGYPYEKIFENCGYDVTYLEFERSKFFIPALRPLFNYIKRSKAIVSEIKTFSPDIVHTHITPLFKYFRLAKLVCRKPRYVHTLHSDPYAIEPRNVKIGKNFFRDSIVEPICLNQTHAEKAVQVYGLKHYLIEKNSIDINSFIKPDIYDQDASRIKLGIKPNAYVIGFVGRLVPVKNVCLLIEVFEIVKKEKKDAVLVIIGDGPERVKCEQLVSNAGLDSSVIFFGEQSDVRNFYWIMDVFVVTSDFESNSIVSVEAQAAGCKCVVSNAVPKDVLVTDRSFRMPENATPETFAEAIVNDVNEYAVNMGDINDFSRKVVMRKLKDDYRELIKNHKR